MKIPIRQGDVSLHLIKKMPALVTKQKNNILAFGEVTGHEHRLDCAALVVYQDKNGNKYVQLLRSARLVHDVAGQNGITTTVEAEKQDKHLAKTIPAGVYAVKYERELDIFSDAIRQVAD